MGCLSGLAALLALAIPLTIARASLPGAIGLIVILAVLAGAAAYHRGRRSWLWRIGVVAVAYVTVVTIVHLVR